MGTREKLEGRVINNLRVDIYLGYNKYLCTCLICGNTRECRSYELKQGKYKACKDCENLESGKSTLATGMMIGYWKLIERSPSGYPNWLCECTICKRIFTVNTKNARRGKSNCCIECANKLRTQDISNKQFKLGRVVKYLDSGYWECACGICGNTLRRSITKLREQDEILCNHCSGIKLQKDLSNKTFGNWQVLERINDSTDSHSKWRCKCLLCGNVYEVFTYNLLSGHSKSCGCTQRIDLTNMQINEWHVDEYLGDQMWRCTCSCGNVRNVSSSDLRYNKIKSCGCKKWENARKTMLTRYGEVAPSKISMPRTTEQIDAVSSKDSLRSFIQKFDHKPTTYELMRELGLQVSTTLKIIHKFGLEDMVDIGSKNSRQFTEVLEYLSTLIDKKDIILNDRSVLDGKELDIYIPSKKLAIEVNGVYWHSTVFKSRTYHQVKSILCGKKGIRLIHIFEYEWENMELCDKLKALLKDSICEPNRVVRARNCIVREIESNEYNEFLNTYHLQKSASTSVKIGCFVNNELLGVIGFGAPRFNNSYEYEIIRLCWKPGVAVTGGLNKMFKYFERKYNPESIITYADLSKFIGSSYLSIGFKPTEGNCFSEPNYVWVKTLVSGYGFEVLNRYQTQKHKLVSMGLCDDEMTEDEVMDSLGYIKIYDSGNIKYTWKSR